MAHLGTVYDFISKVYSVRAMNHNTHEINHLNGRMLRPKNPHEAYTGERSVKNSLWDLRFISLNSWKTVKNWLPHLWKQSKENKWEAEKKGDE